MTLASLLIFVLILFLLYYIVMKFIPEPMRVVALAVIGICALLFLIGALWPGLLNFRVKQ